jgi:ADP-heptose:LPS heptosyltransferase
MKAALLAYFAGVPRRIGPAGPHDRWFSHGVKTARGIHPVDANRELSAVATGMAAPPAEIRQPPTIESGVPATRRMQSLLEEAGIHSLRETLVLIPGSGNWTPRAASAVWPEERFAVLANQASANAVILTGGLGDDARVRETRAGIGKPTMVIRLSDVTVEEFAIVAGGSQAVVGHDGDALHVAAASGAPVVALLRPHDVAPVGRSCASVTAEDLAGLPAQRVVSVLGERLKVDTYA